MSYNEIRLRELVALGQKALPKDNVTEDTVFNNASLKKISGSTGATTRMMSWFQKKVDQRGGTKVKKYDYDKMKKATSLFIEAIGDDPKREGLLETPDRVAKMYQVLLGGYGESNDKHVKLFKAESDDMVTLSNINFFSFCEHHVVLFIGKLHIAYIPKDKVIGVSKLVRIARTHTKKLQIQERLVKDIADDIEKLLEPQGVAVQIQAQHFCMALRGTRSQGSIMTTTAVRGLFKDDSKARNEFLATIKEKESVYAY